VLTDDRTFRDPHDATAAPFSAFDELGRTAAAYAGFSA
jgi:hypothetical protein